MSEYNVGVNKFNAIAPRRHAAIALSCNGTTAFTCASNLPVSTIVNAVSADTLDVYLHQAQVVLVYSSTYLFNQMRKFFDTLFLALHPEKPSYKARNMLKEWGVDINEWSWEGRTKIDNKTVYAVLNKKHRVMLYSRSLDRDMPVSVTFLDDRVWHKNNTITFSKIFKSVSKEKVVNEKTGEALIDMNGKCSITLNFAGNVLEWQRLLERFKPILPPRKKFDFEEGLIRIRPVRQELYVRYHPNAEFDVKKMIDELHMHYGVDTFIDMQKNVEDESLENIKRIQYLASARLVFALPNHHKSLDGRRNNSDRLVKIYVKTYRREKFRNPFDDYADWPKIEFAVYFSNDDSIEEVKHKINFAGNLLASLARSLKLEVVYVDPYQTLTFSPDPSWVRFFKGNLILRNLDELDLSKIQKRVLQKLTFCALRSDDLKEIAAEFEVSVRTVQRHIKKLEELGWVLKVRSKANNKRNQYFYLLNLSAVEENKLIILEETRDVELDAFIEGSQDAWRD